MSLVLPLSFLMLSICSLSDSRARVRFICLFVRVTAAGEERAPPRQAAGPKMRVLPVLLLQGGGGRGLRLHFRTERGPRLHVLEPQA